MQKDLESAYDFCRSTAKNHYENFPVGSVLIPKDERKYIYSIYAFARYADDIADSKNMMKKQSYNCDMESEDITGKKMNSKPILIRFSLRFQIRSVI
ncbi:MAG: squalene/phytoene synthase family protein [Ignavibacteria bacterium]|nr:squalene/phytoene synthase family protein [Ignavibacteria bacterium]